MRIYKCKIKYERTGVTVYDGRVFEKDIYIRAKSVKEANKKAFHYREKDDVKKVIEVYSVEFVLEIDRD